MNRLFYFGVISCLFVSCVAVKPNAKKISAPDYNGRVHVTDPHYVKRTTPIGHAWVLGGTAAGAYLGYSSDLIQFQNGENRSTNKYINAGLGAVIGYGLTSLSNYLVGKNKRIPLDNSEKWIAKSDKDWILYRNTVGTDFITMPKYKESTYEVKNWSDVTGFYRVFGAQSKYGDEVFKKSINVAKRDELPKLILLDQDALYVNDAKIKYYSSSKTVSSLLEAKKKYPNISFDTEKLGIELTKNYSDLDLLISEFPETINRKDLFINSLNTMYTIKESKAIKKKLGVNSYYLTKDDLLHKNYNIKKAYLAILSIAEKPKTFDDYTDLFTKYNWIVFPDRSDLILDKYWKYYYYYYDNGNELVGKIYSISKEYPQLSLDYSDTEKFIEKKLNIEVSNNVEIYATRTLNTKNKLMDSWKSSAFYDAPYILSTGEIKFLHYGKIVNNSKFDLPINIEVNADLIEEEESDILNIISSKGKKKLGKGSQNFLIPLIKKGEEQDFSVLFDFGKGTQSSGVLIIGIQMSTSKNLENFTYNKKFLSSKVPLSSKNKQKLWLDMVNKGLGENPIKNVGLWGERDYNPDDYIFKMEAPVERENRMSRVTLDDSERFKSNLLDFSSKKSKTIYILCDGKRVSDIYAYYDERTGEYSCGGGLLSTITCRVKSYTEFIQCISNKVKERSVFYCTN